MLKNSALLKKVLQQTQKLPIPIKFKEKIGAGWHFLKKSCLYLILLTGIFCGNYYLITNDAVFQKHAIEAYQKANNPVRQIKPEPKEPIAGAATVPAELKDHQGVDQAAADKENNNTDDLPSLKMPVDGRVTTKHGFSYVPVFDDYRFHPGIDIDAATNSDVKAACNGVVKQVEHSKDWNYRLIIDIDNGYEIVYSNLNEIKVAKGDKVEKGQIIGKLGKPGEAEPGTAPHLHLELLKNGKAINPLNTIR
ncbi:MAG: hypothetical protein PWP31_1251 [Clostridia bacterium]|nr:hypothetical protein [Clostridia bacterium]